MQSKKLWQAGAYKEGTWVSTCRPNGGSVRGKAQKARMYMLQHGSTNTSSIASAKDAIGPFRTTCYVVVIGQQNTPLWPSRLENLAESTVEHHETTPPRATPHQPRPIRVLERHPGLRDVH